VTTDRREYSRSNTPATKHTTRKANPTLSIVGTGRLGGRVGTVGAFIAARRNVNPSPSAS
jgi:hypothetical protein